MATVKLEQVTKIYPNGTKAVDGLNLEVGEGELMVLVGPSGCGKTTALRMVAGLEDISDGSLYIGQKRVNDMSPKDRDIAMVFQSYALYPHMTVAENIGFALKLRKTPKAEASAKIDQAAKILGLSEVLDRKPGQLSGGQRQRVAMGRAIVREPSVFLMDEPLSNLDAKLRVQMRAEVSKVQRTLGVATLYVTHDQAEAMTMGDRVAVLRGGVLQQCDTPQTLYDRPANVFVAGFIGSPAMNLWRGVLEGASTGAATVDLGSCRLDVGDAAMAAHPELSRFEGAEVIVGIRPEHLSVAPPSSDGGGELRGRVELVEALGSELMVHFSTDARHVKAEDAADDPAMRTGEVATAGISVARVGPRVDVKPGDPIAFEVESDMMHFFDPATGGAIRQ